MIILAAILAIFVYGMIAATLGTVLPSLSDRFKLTPKQNGSIALAQAIGLMVASVAVGQLIDVQGKKTGLVLGLALVLLALVLLPRSNGYPMILTSLLVLGLGGGIIVTGANALASEIGGDRRATVMNFLNLFFGLGGLATPFLAANLLKGDARKLANLMALFTAVTMAVHIFTPMPAPAGAVSFQFASVPALLGNVSLVLLALTLFLYVAAEVGMWNWLPRHLIAQGVPEGRALNILSLGFALGLLVGRVAVAPILITQPAKTVLLVSAALIAITTFVLLKSAKPSSAWGLVFLTGIAMAPVFPTTLAMVGDRFPDLTATAMGIAITSGWIGLAVSSPLIGSIAGGDPKRLKTALLVLPVAGILMILAVAAL